MRRVPNGADAPTSDAIETWPTRRSLEIMLQSQARAIAAVDAALPALEGAVEAAASRLRQGGRLVYAGAGSSGRIAVQDGVELAPTFGWPAERLVTLIAGGDGALLRTAEGAEDDATAGRGAIGALAPGQADVVVAVAASGSTAWTLAVADAARTAGALTIGVACRARAQLLEVVDHPIALATGDEVLPGSTRLAAGTAQKIALNLFSTQLMMALGRVHRGRMVHMIASNTKLVERGIGMVMELTGASRERAEAAFSQAGRSVPVAVLIVDGMAPDRARRRLEESAGDLGRARRRDYRSRSTATGRWSETSVSTTSALRTRGASPVETKT